MLFLGCVFGWFCGRFVFFSRLIIIVVAVVAVVVVVAIVVAAASGRRWGVAWLCTIFECCDLFILGRSLLGMCQEHSHCSMQQLLSCGVWHLNEIEFA